MLHGNFKAAEAASLDFLGTEPNHPEVLYQLALAYISGGRLEMAVGALVKAIDISRPNAVLHRTLGEVLRRLGRHADAMVHCRQAVVIDPRDPEARYNLGLALAGAGRLAQAIEQYAEALRLNAQHGLAANNMGAAYEKLGDEQSAEAAYRRAVGINPRHAEAQNNLGAVLINRNELSKAAECFEVAIAAAPDLVYAHHNLSGLITYQTDDKHLVTLEGLIEAEPNWPTERRTKFWFALAKARHDTKQFQAAFEAYATGNRLHRSTFHYDSATIQALADTITARFDETTAARAAGCNDASPIFIVGMPRSGTSLIEQILASHPEVHGAGELRDFSDALREVAGTSTQDAYASWLPQASADDLERLGCDYVERLRRHHRKARFITDKMPGNFWLTGIIHLALPNARIIHASRNPMDTCLSNFQTHFKESMPFAYDLAELAHYHRAYQHTMSHFETVLPKGRILTVQYDDLVCNLREHVATILAFIGLDWHEGCLDFHQTQRVVRTASVAQVRKPIYASSSGKWRYYEPWLGELTAALEGRAGHQESLGFTNV